MKNILFLLLLTAWLQSCQQREDYKTIRTEVLEMHDGVMKHSDEAIHNKMVLDTLLRNLDSLKKGNPSLDTLNEKRQLQKLQKELTEADDRMNNWMHRFNADIDGKSKTEAAGYFLSEKKKMMDIDSLYKHALDQSAVYLIKYKKK